MKKINKWTNVNFNKQKYEKGKWEMETWWN